MPTKFVASPGSFYSGSTSEAIKVLMLEISELTFELQNLLNTQATQLLGDTPIQNTGDEKQYREDDGDEGDDEDELDQIMSVGRRKKIMKSKKGKGVRRQSVFDYSSDLYTSVAHDRVNSGIHRTRRHLRKAMARLELVTSAMADTLKHETDVQQAFLNRMERDASRTAKLQKKVRYITQESDEAKLLQKVLTKEQQVDNEINELEARLSELKETKQHLELKKDPLQSVISSRTSSYLGEIEQIQTHQQQVLAAHFLHSTTTADGSSTSSNSTTAEPKLGGTKKSLLAMTNYSRMLKDASNPTELQSAITTAMDALEIQFDAVTSQYTNSVRERDALRDGIVVWKDVCYIVKAMEDSVENAVVEGSTLIFPQNGDGSNDDASSLPASQQQELVAQRISQALKLAHDALTEHFELARKNNWTLLMAAISCELEASTRAFDLVRKHSASSTPLSESVTSGSSYNDSTVLPTRSNNGSSTNIFKSAQLSTSALLTSSQPTVSPSGAGSRASTPITSSFAQLARSNKEGKVRTLRNQNLGAGGPGSPVHKVLSNSSSNQGSSTDLSASALLRSQFHNMEVDDSKTK